MSDLVSVADLLAEHGVAHPSEGAATGLTPEMFAVAVSHVARTEQVMPLSLSPAAYSRAQALLGKDADYVLTYSDVLDAAQVELRALSERPS